MKRTKNNLADLAVSVKNLIRPPVGVVLGSPREVKGTFAGRPIFEVRGGDPVALMAALDAAPMVEKTSLFGTAVHAVIRDAAASEDSIRTALGSAAGATALTLPLHDEDWFRVEVNESRDLVITADLQPGGTASALLFRDADNDSLPDDLDGDTVADPVGTVTTQGNRVRISNVPNVQNGDVFLVRIFNASGQVEYDLNIAISD